VTAIESRALAGYPWSEPVKRSLVFALVFACTPQPRPPAAPSPSSLPEEDEWRHASWEERHDTMTFLVLPRMARSFQRFEDKLYPDLTCLSCHGAEAERVQYRMPNGPPLDPAHLPRKDSPDPREAYPYVDERATFALGEKLAPLRGEGILFVASGGMTHNLAMPFGGPVPSFAAEFDAWATEALARRDVDALVDWRQKAPASLLAHPDDGGHFRVLFAALGVATGDGHATFPITGFEGSLSTRCVELA
jgi:hypothetical protein